jgi:hypothetical protein
MIGSRVIESQTSGPSRLEHRGVTLLGSIPVAEYLTEIHFVGELRQLALSQMESRVAKGD